MYGKRLTLPERWATPRFTKLRPHEKLGYLYILDKCDWAGFLEIDEERISFDTKIPEEEVFGILEKLDEEEIVLGNGWLLVVDFIELQGNSSLNPNNNAHKNIIAKINDNNIYFKGNNRAEKNLAPYLDLVRGSGKGKAIGKGISQSMSKGTTKPVWNMSFDCGVCNAKKGEQCKFKDECKFPSHCIQVSDLNLLSESTNLNKIGQNGHY